MINLLGCSKTVELTKYLDIRSIHISPTRVDVPINSEYQFYLIGVDKKGNPHKIEATSWRVSTNLGTVDATGLFKSSSNSGSGSIYAYYGSFYDYAYITVTPGELASIQISPASATFAVGDSYTFTASGKDAYGNTVSVSPTWQVEGDIGTLSSSYYSYLVDFTASTTGTGYLKAISGSIEAIATIEVINIIPYTYVSQWTTFVGTTAATPSGIEIDSGGNLWVSMYTGAYGSYVGTVAKYDSSGNFVSSLESTIAGEGSFEMPNDIAFDSAGNIYIVDYEADKIRKYDSSGNFLLSWGGSGSSIGKFNHPARIAIMNDYIYITDNYNSRVQKFDSSGNFVMQWGGYGTKEGKMNNPSGIAIDTQNNIFIADQNNYRIQKFDSLANFVKSWGSEGTAIGEFGRLTGITMDTNDYLYITDYENNRVYKYDNQGNFITRWGKYGISNSQFNGPIDVAVDNSGNVYVVDSGNKRIQKFSP